MSSSRPIASLRTAFVLGLTSCSDSAGDADKAEAVKPGVLLVTLDTVRADRLRVYGNARIRTPALDRLCEEGSVFENAFTAIPSTLPSHCTLMTGTYPSRHGVHDNGVYFLENSAQTLAEVLKLYGFATAAFVASFVLDRRFGLSQGFDVYDDAMEEALVQGDPDRIRQDPKLSEEQKKWFARTAGRFQRRASSVTARAVEWVEELDGRPFFLWVHYFDAHQPYQPPPPWDRAYDPGYEGELDGDMNTFFKVAAKNRWTPRTLPAAEKDHMVALYDGEISTVDESLGTLLDALRKKGRWSSTLVVVVADHGEGFGEHEQIWEHNWEIFDETMRVPLIVRDPEEPSVRRVTELARTLDVAPTILDWLELTVPASCEGCSLLPAMEGRSSPRIEDALLEARRKVQVHSDGQTPLLGLRTATHKLILTLDLDERVIRRQLFDLDQDRGESRPPDSDSSEQLETRLREIERASSGDRSALPVRSLEDIDIEGLESIGYIEPKKEPSPRR